MGVTFVSTSKYPLLLCPVLWDTPGVPGAHLVYVFRCDEKSVFFFVLDQESCHTDGSNKESPKKSRAHLEPTAASLSQDAKTQGDSSEICQIHHRLIGVRDKVLCDFGEFRKGERNKQAIAEYFGGTALCEEIEGKISAESIARCCPWLWANRGVLRVVIMLAIPAYLKTLSAVRVHFFRYKTIFEAALYHSAARCSFHSKRQREAEGSVIFMVSAS